MQEHFALGVLYHVTGLEAQVDFYKQKWESAKRDNSVFQESLEQAQQLIAQLNGDVKKYKDLYDQSLTAKTTYACDTEHIDMRNPCIPDNAVHHVVKDVGEYWDSPLPKRGKGEGNKRPMHIVVPFQEWIRWMDPSNSDLRADTFHAARTSFRSCRETDLTYPHELPSVRAKRLHNEDKGGAGKK